MAIYITETDAPRPYASSPRAVLFVDAAGNTVASWTPGDIDDHGTANLPDLGVFPLTLQATRAELAALDYVLTDEFPPADADADDLDFARETLGEAATSDEVFDLAQTRATIRANEPPAAPTYTYRAAREAFEWAGKSYADYIEAHTAELVAKGHDVADQSLSEALQGNDGD